MNDEEIAAWNSELRDLTPIEITRWAISRAGGRAVVSTNFRPYEAVILHLCVQVQPDIPVLWVDHGYNRPATYRHAEQLKKRLGLNVKAFVPRITAAHRDAVHGPVPTPEDEAGAEKIQRGDEAGTVRARDEGTRAKGLDHRVAEDAKSESGGTGYCVQGRKIRRP